MEVVNYKSSYNKNLTVPESCVLEDYNDKEMRSKFMVIYVTNFTLHAGSEKL